MKHDVSSNTITFEHFELLDLEKSSNNLIDFNLEIDFGEDYSRVLSDFIGEELTPCYDEHKHAQSFNLKTNLKIDHVNINTNFINREKKRQENVLKKRDGTSKNLIDYSNSILYFLLNKNNQDLVGYNEKMYRF